jgi:hypothetical protein
MSAGSQKSFLAFDHKRHGNALRLIPDGDV